MNDFHNLYVRYAGDVHRFASYLCGDAALADDITALLLVLETSSGVGTPDHELATLQKIREYQRYRNQFFAFGLAFAITPLAFAVTDGELKWLMLRDNPTQAGIFLVASAYCWISRYILGRRHA